MVQNCGVVYKKLDRVVREIERKSIHLSGVLIPLTYAFMISRFGEKDAQIYITRVAWFMTCGTWIADLLRVNVPYLKENWPMQKYLRAKERDKITGMCFFSLGCS